MKLKKNTHRKKLNILFISIILLVFGIILTVFFKYRNGIEISDRTGAVIPDKANISIGRAHQTATRNGIKEWSLDAASADYMTEKNQAVFKDLSLTFFLKDRTKVYVTADRGLLKTDSNDMEISNNVVVKYSRYKLRCESLYYEHKKRIIVANVPVNITGDSFQLVADAMSLNLNTNRTLFEGKVKGTFRGGISL
ncbi:MAG: LPS export ABC transporter periplasmic protein LptC [Desulfobacterales bacterium]|jgi:LPS export ABC transporter protein LptC|nr:LPS export ABC transporter periplasmic protein LptC [Desulfobacterales bacterium]